MHTLITIYTDNLQQIYFTDLYLQFIITNIEYALHHPTFHPNNRAPTSHLIKTRHSLQAQPNNI
jgi:hypothetical protein